MVALIDEEQERSDSDPRPPAARSAGRVRSAAQPLVVIGGTVLVFLGPALWDVLSDPTRPYGYLAADAFYYFTIATNWVRFGAPTFDQVHPTNGFHPLWQWLTALGAAAIEGLGHSRFALPVVAVIAGLLLLSATLVLLGLSSVKNGRVSPVFALLPLGAWPLAMSPVWWEARSKLPGHQLIPLFGTFWNFSNGMESALLLALFAGVVWFYVKRPPDTRFRAIAFGLLLGALALARLDHAIFAVTIAGLPFAYHLIMRDARRTRLDAWTLLAWLGVLLIYLGYNVATMGTAMPVSGAVKSTFPHPNASNLQELRAIPALGIRDAMFRIGRLGSVGVPALLAVAYLPFALELRSTLRRRTPVLRVGHGRFSELMLLTAIGVVGLAAYDLTFVVSYQIGEWYAPISVLFSSLFVLQIAERLADNWPSRVGRWLGYGVFLALHAIGLMSFWNLHRPMIWGSDYAAFCLGQAKRVIDHYGSERPKLLSRDDGVVAFATGFPTTSGMRLAIDPEAAQASDEGRFEQLLASRGVDRITALHYLNARGFVVGERSRRVQRFAEAVLLARPTRVYEVEYVDRWFGILRARSPQEQ
jgi:hypothetical protein